jgi:hypothetical protein
MNLVLEKLTYSGGAMPTQQDISTHYTHGNLVAAIRSGVESLGKTIDSVTVDDLAPVDEFHTGGRQASEHFIDQLGVTPICIFLMSDVALAGPRGSLPAGTGAGSTESISLPNISRPDA